MATTRCRVASPGRFSPAFLALVLALLYLGDAAFSPVVPQQDSTAPPDSSAIEGQLVARATQAPIGRATVEIAGTRFATTTDSLGQFALTGLSSGRLLLEIHAVGYATASWRIRIKPGTVFTYVFEMDPLPYELPDVVVKGRQPLAVRRFADFERRRQSGMGYFLTQEHIERNHPATLVDVLVTARGVEQVCLSNDCVAKMVRSPRGCYPQYFLDGVASTAYFARHTPPGDVRGVEIYRGASETPGEFEGSNSGCGVIVIWTKSSP
jgi:carboxypeptidase-like protein